MQTIKDLYKMDENHNFFMKCSLKIGWNVTACYSLKK